MPVGFTPAGIIGQADVLSVRIQHHKILFVWLQSDLGCMVNKILTDLGFELRDLNSLEMDRLEVPGALVISIYRDSKIAKTNMDPGYIITSVNDNPISNVDEFIEAYKEASGEIWFNGYYETYPGEWPYKFRK